jgi:hypothetical protein
MAATIGRLRDIASVLGLGLRNYWYPVILSSRVDASGPVAVRALGEELAIWRDIAGNVHVFFYGGKLDWRSAASIWAR